MKTYGGVDVETRSLLNTNILELYTATAPMLKMTPIYLPVGLVFHHEDGGRTFSETSYSPICIRYGIICMLAVRGLIFLRNVSIHLPHSNTT
jgi:hypothetical protein